MILAREKAAYVRDEYETFRQPKIECYCCEILCFGVSAVIPNFYMLKVFTEPLAEIIGLMTVY